MRWTALWLAMCLALSVAAPAFAEEAETTPPTGTEGMPPVDSEPPADDATESEADAEDPEKKSE